jgi:hypothetical protein
MDGDDGSETTVEASVRVTATEVVSYSVYSAPLPPPPPYEPPSVNYYYRYNGQQISGVHVPYEATNSNMVIITQPASPQQIPVKQSFGCHYFWSCITFWFCGLFFGGIAFILAGKFLNLAR